MEYEEKERLKQVDFANQIIIGQKGSVLSDTAIDYFDIQKRIHKSYVWVDSLDKHIQDKLSKQGTTIPAEFRNSRKIEEILMKDSLIYRFKRELSELNFFIKKKKYKVDDDVIQNLIPLKDTIVTLAGESINWERFLFLHKPTAVSYLQIKRIKLLLLDYENVYQNAGLKSASYEPGYYSEKKKQIVIDERRLVSTKIKYAPSLEKIKIENNTQSKKQEFEHIVEKPIPNGSSQIDNYNILYQKLLDALHTENFYVGINNTILNNFSELKNGEFSLQAEPVAEVSQSANNYSIYFRKPGEYTIRILDKRPGKEHEIFEKKINVSRLPNPVVYLNNQNQTKDFLTKSELMNMTRLVCMVELNNGQRIQGHINGFRVNFVQKNEGLQNVYNYSEVFQFPTLSVIGKLQKGDIIYFDNITVSLVDGTTRTPQPILFKIVE